MSKKKRAKAKNADPLQQAAYPQHHYRGKDVSGALGFVSSLMDWDLFPKEKRPTTDRAAAALFFELDRSNATMAEFLEHLQEYNEIEREKLRAAPRVPPKRLIGFINMATGEKRAAFPDFITLPASAYDQLLDLVTWSDATPACVELSDRAWESIHDSMVDLVEVDDTRWPGVFVDSVQIETVATMQRNITPGTLVALLSHEDQDSGDTEHHCVLVRGDEESDPDYERE